MAALRSVVLPKRRTLWRPGKGDKEAAKANPRLKRIMKVSPKPRENGEAPAEKHAGKRKRHRIGLPKEKRKVVIIPKDS